MQTYITLKEKIYLKGSSFIKQFYISSLSNYRQVVLFIHTRGRITLEINLLSIPFNNIRNRTVVDNMS